MTYTVEYVNSALATGRWIGKFDTLEEATAYAKEQARKSRPFVSYRVCEGTAKNPGKPIGEIYKGNA